MSSIARARARAPCRSSARSTAARSSGSSNAAGSGTAPPIGATICGFVPQVTCGSSAETSTVSSRSNAASVVGRQRAPRVERPLPPLPSARPAGPRGTRTSSRPARSARPARPTRSTCCRRSGGPPSRSRGSTSPAYSTTWPTPPETPIWPISAEDHVLRRHAAGQVALERDAHRLRPLLRQRLRREHVLDLGRADAERERAERAVRRRVAVAADDRHARAA